MKRGGKFHGKRQKGNDGREVKAEADYELNEFKLGSPKFDSYYKVSLYR